MIARMADDPLARLRVSLDALDAEILGALAKRMALSRDVGVYKRTHDAPYFDENRFRQLMEDRTRTGVQLSLSEDFVRDIFKRIHEESVAQQEHGATV